LRIAECGLKEKRAGGHAFGLGFPFPNPQSEIRNPQCSQGLRMSAEAPSPHQRADRLYASLSSCEICPRRCRVNRLEGEIGFCGVAEEALLASSGPHFGEEDVLVGQGGSGTIFFAGCNLRCIFCQNYDLSHGRAGSPASPGETARAMLRRNLGLYGLGGIVVPFLGIKAIDLVVSQLPLS
jgi:putative pyruvate formate lyase activating enzyme